MKPSRRYLSCIAALAWACTPAEAPPAFDDPAAVGSPAVGGSSGDAGGSGGAPHALAAA